MSEKKYLLTFGEIYEAALNSVEIARFLRGIPVLGVDTDRLEEQLLEHEHEERTCRMTQYGPEYVLAGWWHCSECEGPVYPPCNEEIAVWALQQCPRCGAKVVE